MNSLPLPDLYGFGPLLLAGTWMTIKLATWSLVVSFVLGLIGASAKLSAFALLRGMAFAYTTLVRGVPDLVLMLLIFFGVQTSLASLTDALGWHYVDINPFGAGIVTIGFIYGAYFTETFRGAIQSIPKGQIEAAIAYGLNRRHVFFAVVLPQTMYFALPGISNNWLVLLKATALVSLIGLSDLIDSAQSAGKSTYNMFFFLTVAALFYLFLTTVSNAVFRRLESQYSRGFRRRA